MGAVAFSGAIAQTLDAGEIGPGFPIEVFNVLGAGDGFMSGLTKGWLEDAPWPVALKYANACGAFAVSRHGCTPAYPSWTELQFFLNRGVVTPALRHDPELEQIHWSTNRRKHWSGVKAFAFDHRSQLQDISGATPLKIARFKELCLQAATLVANGQDGFGVLCDNRLGKSALHQAAGQGLWIGRPVEWPGSRPLTLEPEIGADYGGLSEWPLEHVVKVLCFCHPDDATEMRDAQEAVIARLYQACRRNRLEMLLEVIPSKVGPVDDHSTARLIARFYDIGVYPDWWKLEPMTTHAAWQATCDAIATRDPYVQGIVVLGLGQTEAELAASFVLAAQFPLVKGFAVGRTIHGDVGRDWIGGGISDDVAVATMAANFERLCRIWDNARSGLGESA
jgi:5-dehydro-2-deoxygluconokinase